jgi:hypothetical protein
MERGTPSRPLGDGSGQPAGRLPDQEDIQEAGEEEGWRLPTLHYSVRKVRERGQALKVPGLLPGVAEKPFEQRRRVLHLLPIPSRDTIRLLKANFTAVEADERAL